MLCTNELRSLVQGVVLPVFCTSKPIDRSIKFKIIKEGVQDN